MIIVASWAAKWHRLSGTRKGKITIVIKLYFLISPKVALKVFLTLAVESSASIGASGSSIGVTLSVLSHASDLVLIWGWE